MGTGNLRILSRTLKKTTERLENKASMTHHLQNMLQYRVRKFIFPENTVYALIIPQEEGKQLALMAALFSIKIIVEKFKRAV